MSLCQCKPYRESRTEHCSNPHMLCTLSIGLVARGALFANNGSLEKAVLDFEKALEIDREHRNARKYLCETLVALARGLQVQEDRKEEALSTYKRVLELAPRFQDALDGINSLQVMSMCTVNCKYATEESSSQPDHMGHSI